MQTSDLYPNDPATADKSSATFHPSRTDAHFDAVKYTPAPMARDPFGRRTLTAPTPVVGNPNSGIVDLGAIAEFGCIDKAADQFWHPVFPSLLLR